ncbi:hypothetical protein SCHPADRAFT_924428 [Schizopora paradoxa]|uniref:RRM domain-containing protein n=1 Tax=Schizopora paradoxa TaxID=27342 RepID=A0A0H2SCP5_9AGAM|nr:hypothetical protein SCHPADRAFT_924428 [Schizopora paradoxa]
MSTATTTANSTTLSLPRVAAGASQETQEEAFSTDPRFHFSTVTRRWCFEDDDGNEFEYDAAKGAWVSVVDDELLRKQQAAYSVAGVDEEAPAAPVLARQNKKRKEPEDYTSATSAEAGPSTKKGKSDKKPQERKSKNTALYVTGLPADADVDEVISRFSKCGVIEEDDEGEPKVKMYAKEDGTFSGDALIVYFKEESVALAVAMLDDAELRIGDDKTRMNVSLAQFTNKETHSHQNGESKPRRVVDKKKVSRRLGKMQKKLEEWDDEDNFGPSPDPVETAAPKAGRVVVLKHMFTLEALKEDATLLLDLKEDVREECSQLGEVTNVVLYDLEPEGIMTIKFRDPLSAQACILKMQGRFFDGKRIEASLYSGRQRFKRSGTHDDYAEEEGDASEKKRLDDFAKWLTEGD